MLFLRESRIDKPNSKPIDQLSFQEKGRMLAANKKTYLFQKVPAVEGLLSDLAPRYCDVLHVGSKASCFHD